MLDSQPPNISARDRTPAPPVLDYAGPVPDPGPPEERFDASALVLGLCLFVPFVTGIMAIILGAAVIHAARRRGERSSLAVAAIILGAINIAGWLLLASGAMGLGLR